MSANNWLPQINPKRCTGCGQCVTQCPTDALEQKAEKAIIARPEACTYCALCEDICPEQAISLPFLICFEQTNQGKHHD
ncbi:MAG: 4Fe-4S binding protein [Anaerolineae bacterium]|nr:4Fe-4S binding protein [Anaerolineae bacterium]